MTSVSWSWLWNGTDVHHLLFAIITRSKAKLSETNSELDQKCYIKVLYISLLTSWHQLISYNNVTPESLECNRTTVGLWDLSSPLQLWTTPMFDLDRHYCSERAVRSKVPPGAHFVPLKTWCGTQLLQALNEGTSDCNIYKDACYSKAVWCIIIL